MVAATESPQVESRGGRLVLETSDDVKVLLDASQMHQALANLIRNAAEAEPGGEVMLSCERRGDGSVRVSVADQGPGIAADMLPLLFVPFKTDKQGGSGLGLTIVKSLVELQDGDLSFETEIGKGTVFHIDLKVAHG